MKKFLKNRSKILFVVAILSLLLFVLSLPELINYSEYMSYMGMVDEEVYDKILDNTNLLNIMNTSISGGLLYVFNSMAFVLMMVASLTSIVGFLFKKLESIFISIGLYVMIICMSIYMFDPVGIIILIILLILNILGYMEQYKINNKMKKQV